MSKQVKEALKNVFDENQIFFEEAMRNHTSFKIGGPASVFACPKNIEQIQALKEIVGEQLPIYILGNGSNILIDDEGYEGCILQIGKMMNDIEILGKEIRVQAGAKLSKLAAEAMRAKLSGLEFASGIPGTVGGAIVMNAGAYGGQMKDVVKEVTMLDADGNVHVLKGEEMLFSYRHSIVKDQPFIVLEVRFSLEEGEISEIMAKQNEYSKRRTEKQPLEYASAGSTFKRPEGYFAGKLIMDSNLRGFAIGDAEVSEKHCGFVINKGNATAKEVKAVIKHVQETVLDKFGVKLEREVIFLERR